MCKLICLVVCVWFVTSQAQTDCGNKGSWSRSCGNLDKFNCEARGCCYDETEPNPGRKCVRVEKSPSFSFTATAGPGLSFGGEPGYPGNQFKRGCFPFIRNIKCDRRLNAKTESDCLRWGCCWDEEKKFCHKSLYNIVRLRKDCPPGYINPPGCELAKCRHSPCLNGAVCKDTATGYECECAPGYHRENCGIRQCPSPGKAHLTVYPDKDTWYDDGDVTTFVCDPYHRMFGSAQRVCEKGHWNPVASPACVSLPCPNLRPVSDGGFAPIDFQYLLGEVVNYFCNGGFALSGSSTSIKCIDPGPPSLMGVWEPPEPAGCTLISPTNTACLSFPCLNGGTCLHKPAPPFFECVCTPIATGPTCSIPP